MDYLLAFYDGQRNPAFETVDDVQTYGEIDLSLVQALSYLICEHLKARNLFIRKGLRPQLQRQRCCFTFQSLDRLVEPAATSVRHIQWDLTKEIQIQQPLQLRLVSVDQVVDDL